MENEFSFSLPASFHLLNDKGILNPWVCGLVLGVEEEEKEEEEATNPPPPDDVEIDNVPPPPKLLGTTIPPPIQLCIVLRM